jgi:hypothetical protein
VLRRARARQEAEAVNKAVDDFAPREQTLMASPSARIAGMSFLFGLIPHDLSDPVPSAHRHWIDVITI